MSELVSFRYRNSYGEIAVHTMADSRVYSYERTFLLDGGRMMPRKEFLDSRRISLGPQVTNSLKIIQGEFLWIFHKTSFCL